MGIIIESERFLVRLGGPNTTDQVVSRLGFPANGNITQANFPLRPRRIMHEVEFQIVDPNRPFTKEEGLIILGEAGFGRPTYEEALRLVEQYGRKMKTSSKKPFLIFLHEAWLDLEKKRWLLCFFRSPERPWLHLNETEIGFFDTCVLPGVKFRRQI